MNEEQRKEAINKRGKSVGHEVSISELPIELQVDRLHRQVAEARAKLEAVAESDSLRAVLIRDALHRFNINENSYYSSGGFELLAEIDQLRAEFAAASADRDEWRLRAEKAEADTAWRNAIFGLLEHLGIRAWNEDRMKDSPAGPHEDVEAQAPATGSLSGPPFPDSPVIPDSSAMVDYRCNSVMCQLIGRHTKICLESHIPGVSSVAPAVADTREPEKEKQE